MPRHSRSDTQRINILDKHLHQLFYQKDARGGTYVVELAEVKYEGSQAVHRIGEGVNPSIRKAIDEAYTKMKTSQPVLNTEVTANAAGTPA